MTMHKTLVDLVDNRVTTTLRENSVDIPKENVDVLIIGHGSKDPNSGYSIDYIVNELKPFYRNVSRCYLEIEGPTIEEGIQACEKNNQKF